MFEGIEILDAVRTDGLYGHQLSAHQQLASVGCLPDNRGSVVMFSEVIVGDKVAPRQKATPGEDFLKPV